MLLENGADALIDGWYSCCHHADFTGECGCRKPAPGMLYRAAADFGIDLKNSFMIGDRMSDLRAGVNAGCMKSVLVRTGYGSKVEAEAAAAGFMIADDLLSAVDELLN
jgi:D-glycero-D-manno-heptose 1,7-bisphosphate phosphatase